MVSLLNADSYKRHFANSKLFPADLVLRDYSGGRIACLGFVRLNVSIADTHTTVFNFCFYVVEHGDSMMGVNLFDAFQGTIEIGETSVLSVPVHDSAKS